MSGRKMSRVMTQGWCSLIIESAPAALPLTRPLKPFSRATSSRTLAKLRSFSTISRMLSPGFASARSSPASFACGDASCSA
jgi:hypothetical protein